MKFIIRNVRLHQAQALEVMLNEMVANNYELAYRFGPLFWFKPSGEVTVYQVVTRQANKKKFLDFCSEFDVYEEDTLDYGCLSILASKQPQPMIMDPDIEEKTYNSMAKAQFWRMLLVLFGTFFFVYLVFNFVGNVYEFATVSFENFIWLMGSLVLIQLIDICQSTYSLVKKQNQAKFKSRYSIFGVIKSLWFVLYSVNVMIPMSMALPFVFFFVMILPYKRFPKVWKNKFFNLQVYLVIAGLFYFSDSDLNRMLTVVNRGGPLNQAQQEMIELTGNDREAIYYETENSFLVYGEMLTYGGSSEESQEVNDRVADYYYFRVKESVLSDFLFEEISKEMNSKRVFYTSGDSGITNYVTISDDDEIILFRYNPSDEVLEKAKATLFQTKDEE